MSEKKDEARPMKEPTKPHRDKIKPDGAIENESSEAEKSQSSMLVPEKQGGIAGP